MEKYKFFEEHTADVAFEAYGKTLEELFANAGLAVQETQVRIDKVEQKESKEISLENEDVEKLLFDFLTELVYYKDAELLILTGFELSIEHKEKYILKGKLSGEKLDFHKHGSKVDVKAITWHMFKIEETGDGWKCFVIVDI